MGCCCSAEEPRPATQSAPRLKPFESRPVSGGTKSSAAEWELAGDDPPATALTVRYPEDLALAPHKQNEVKQAQEIVRESFKGRDIKFAVDVLETITPTRTGSSQSKPVMVLNVPSEDSLRRARKARDALKLQYSEYEVVLNYNVIVMASVIAQRHWWRRGHSRGISMGARLTFKDNSGIVGGFIVARGRGLDEDVKVGLTTHHALAYQPPHDDIQFIDPEIQIQDRRLDENTRQDFPDGVHILAASGKYDERRTDSAFISDWALLLPISTTSWDECYYDSHKRLVRITGYESGEIGRRKIDVIVDGRVYTSGQTNPIPSLLQIDGKRSGGLTIQTSLRRMLAPGVSGAWVVDSAKRLVCGYIYAVSLNMNTAYFIPIQETLDQINRQPDIQAVFGAARSPA